MNLQDFDKFLTQNTKELVDEITKGIFLHEHEKAFCETAISKKLYSMLTELGLPNE